MAAGSSRESGFLKAPLEALFTRLSSRGECVSVAVPAPANKADDGIHILRYRRACSNSHMRSVAICSRSSA
jgi:hypothetical protein